MPAKLINKLIIEDISLEVRLVTLASYKNERNGAMIRRGRCTAS